MTLTLKDYLLAILLVALVVTAVLWGIQKNRADSLAAERALSQSLRRQDSVIKEYFPARLNGKNSDELTGMGINLWKE